MGRRQGIKRSNKDRFIAPETSSLITSTLNEFMDQYAMDSMATFEYEGLPDTVQVQHIEEPLFYSGHCVFTLHKDTKLPIVLPCTLSGYNIHNEPTHFTIVTRNDDRETYTQYGKLGVDGVLIKNNVFLKPTRDLLMMYVQRITNTALTLDMNVYAMRTPLVFETDEYSATKNAALADMYDQFKPVIFTTRRQALGDKEEVLKVHETGVTSHITDLMNYQHDLENNLYTRFGIYNAMQDKKERMLVDEVNAKEDQIALSQSISLDYREFAIKQINELFDQNIKVMKKGENKNESSEHSVSDNSDMDN